jgi:NodT family efflux transporter outer membrane factor (OMF) lipoprotein
MFFHQRLRSFAPVSIGGSLLCLLAGCAVGPDFKAPPAPQADRYTASALPTQTVSTPVPGGESQAFAIGKQLPAQWWTLFGSDRLDRLVMDAFAGSPTLTAAEATLRQAQESYVETRSLLFPSVDGQASVTRERISGAQVQTAPSLFNLFDASVNVSYGIDLFGGTRRAVEAQNAALDYQRYELQAAYQTLAANVITAAVGEASLRAQVAATQDIVQALQHQLDVTRRQYGLGGAAYSDVLSATANLAAQQALLPGLEKQLSQTRHRLAVYLGKLPSESVQADFDLSELTLPSELPITLPSSLVQQRPDIRAAEAQLHQASANIGIATVNMLPKISLTGSYGDEASHAGDLFSSGIWSLGAGIVQPIFHAGELRAKRRAAVDAYDAAAAQYRQTVLLAFANVADALRALETDARALAAQHDAATTAQDSLKLVEKQYTLGGVSYLQLLTAQQQYQQTQITYVQALASRYQDTVALFQALGGDWSAAMVTASATTTSPAPTDTPTDTPTGARTEGAAAASQPQAAAPSKVTSAPPAGSADSH